MIDRIVIAPRNPLLVFAGTSTMGLFRSTDGGTTWTQSNVTDELSGFHISSIASGTKIPVTVYAGSDVGVYKSTDSGASWQPTGLIATATNQDVSST